MSWLKLFTANLKILYRNWRGMFWNIALPIALYVGLSLLRINTGIGGAKIDYSSFLLPGMIALTIAQTGIFSLAYWLVDLKSRGVLKRLRATPLSNFEMLSALISTRLVIMLVQVALLTWIGSYFFHVHFHGSIFIIILLAIFGGAGLLSIGFLISTITNSYDEAAPITTVINLLFTFLGNIFFPTQILPKALRAIGQVLPISYLADGLRGQYLGNASTGGTIKDLAALLIWLIVLFSAATYMFRKAQGE